MLPAWHGNSILESTVPSNTAMQSRNQRPHSRISMNYDSATSKYTLRTMNSNVFRLPGCRLKWQPWSARRVSLDTCDKNRIRKCATSNHRLACGCLGWVARGDFVQFLPVQVRRGPSARGTDSGNLNGERLNQIGSPIPHETLDGPRLVETLRNHSKRPSSQIHQK